MDADQQPIESKTTMSTPPPASVERQSTRVWKIVLGAVCLLIAAFNSTNLAPATSLAGQLGRLTGFLTLIFVAIWLIRTGLPRSLGGPELVRTRRRIWFQLVGIGFLVMITLSTLLAVWLSLFTLAVLVTWLYWFGWTWVSWLIADKRAVRQYLEQKQHEVSEVLEKLL